MFGADYPFLDLLWTMLMFFLFIIWIWILISIFGDVFRRQDKGGFGKALWILFLVLVPYLAAFIYIIANGRGMAERQLERQREGEAQLAAYVRSVGASADPAAQIERARQLLDAGTISQAEFDQLKAKALG